MSDFFMSQINIIISAFEKETSHYLIHQYKNTKNPEILQYCIILTFNSFITIFYKDYY